MVIQKISSAGNPLIKEYRKLCRSRNYRMKSGKIALEGPNLISEALLSGLKAEVIFIGEEFKKSNLINLEKIVNSNIPVLYVPTGLFKSISDTEKPQMVAAIFRFSGYEETAPEVHASSLMLFLDRIQDPGNLGTIIRTAAAAGADNIFYNRGTTDPFNQKSLRASAGSIFRINLIPVSDSVQCLENLRNEGVSLIAASVNGGSNYSDVCYKRPVALIIGNEAGGITGELENLAEKKITIPLSNNVESLNAAVAAGVVLFEIKRSRSAACS